ncbi:hypothetical protein ZWY2020_052149 [Hordeum vulgare]|nr:hypothetical protein ZWY2020_052149 [Hordeum vulgare]
MVRAGTRSPPTCAPQLVNSSVESRVAIGETNSANKTPTPCRPTTPTSVSRTAWCSGTTANGSTARLAVYRMATEISKIHSDPRGLAEDDDTPPKRSSTSSGDATKIIGLICILVWLIKVKYFLTFELDGWVPRNIHPSIYI